jgi:hypothetical protein
MSTTDLSRHCHLLPHVSVCAYNTRVVMKPLNGSCGAAAAYGVAQRLTSSSLDTIDNRMPRCCSIPL